MTLVEDPVKQHVPVAWYFVPTQMSQATWPLSGSAAGKFTVIVLPGGASVGETVRVPDGGSPGFEAGRTVTLVRPCADPPRPSATEASYGTVAVRASVGAAKEFPVGIGKAELSIQPKSQSVPTLGMPFVQAIRRGSLSASEAVAMRLTVLPEDTKRSGPVVRVGKLLSTGAKRSGLARDFAKFKRPPVEVV